MDIREFNGYTRIRNWKGANILLLHWVLWNGIESDIKWAQCTNKYTAQHKINVPAGNGKAGRAPTREWQIRVRVPISAIFTTTFQSELETSGICDQFISPRITNECYRNISRKGNFSTIECRSIPTEGIF